MNADAKMSMPRFSNGLLLFTNEASRSEKMILKEANKNVTNYDELCEVFNKSFSNVVASLNVPNVNNVNIISIQN